MAPSRVVVLRYGAADRPDQQATYYAGTQRRLLRKLEQIETYVAADLTNVDLTQLNPTISGILAKRYKLAYEAGVSPATFRTRLASVQECGQDADGELCFPPTTFRYSGENVTTEFCDNDCPGRSANYVTVPLSQSEFFRTLGEFNGDGRGDLLFKGGGGGYYIASFSGAGTAVSTAPAGALSAYTTVLPGDFDGDNLTDLFFIELDKGSGSYGKNELYLNRSDARTDGAVQFEKHPGVFAGGSLVDPAWFPQVTVTRVGEFGTSVETHPTRAPVTADFNGDGVTDLLIKWCVF